MTRLTRVEFEIVNNFSKPLEGGGFERRAKALYRSDDGDEYEVWHDHPFPPGYQNDMRSHAEREHEANPFRKRP